MIKITTPYQRFDKNERHYRDLIIESGFQKPNWVLTFPAFYINFLFWLECLCNHWFYRLYDYKIRVIEKSRHYD